MKNDPTLFHFTFHKIFDLPEALTADRERLYLQHFYDELGYKPTAVEADHFARAFNEPGAIRAGFAMHVHPGVPWGTVSVEAGPVNASSDNLRISIEGVGGHGAYPHLARATRSSPSPTPSSRSNRS